MRGLTKENLRHLSVMLRRGKRSAPAIYESIGPDNFLAPAPGWLNIGLWESEPNFQDAEGACRALVQELCGPLPSSATLLDVGNGLGAQDPVIKEALHPVQLIAVNITHSQLTAGRSRLAEANAEPVVADAVELPFRSNAVNGIISVEAAFHFSSRREFFREAFRVLTPGGAISLSDITVERRPTNLRLKLIALAELRVWGVRFDAAVPGATICKWLEEAGFTEVQLSFVTERTIDPAVEFFRQKLNRSEDVPAMHRFAGSHVVEGWASLREAGVIEYALISARKAQ